MSKRIKLTRKIGCTSCGKNFSRHQDIVKHLRQKHFYALPRAEATAMAIIKAQQSQRELFENQNGQMA